jgi:hypothetical protein
MERKRESEREREKGKNHLPQQLTKDDGHHQVGRSHKLTRCRMQEAEKDGRKRKASPRK